MPDKLITLDNLSEFKGQIDTLLAGKEPNLTSQTAYTTKGSATKVPQITTNSKGQVTAITEVTITQPTADDLSAVTYTSQSKTSEAKAQARSNLGLGTAATKDTGTSEGNVPVLGSNGKLPDSVIPAIAITDTFVVANEAAMLALTAEVGDVAVRTDEKKSYILKTAGADTLSHWEWLKTPDDVVSSVNGSTGAVTLHGENLKISAASNTTIKAELDSKQSTLVGSGSGQNVKTIHSNSIVGSGDIVLYTTATNTEIDALFA